jgi:serine/threonine-protein kinase SMG1
LIIIFDKSLKLKVSERVPFRMTPAIQSSLSVLGVDGLFRIACETLLVMKKSTDSY